jgi:hypothetical protein
MGVRPTVTAAAAVLAVALTGCAAATPHTRSTALHKVVAPTTTTTTVPVPSTSTTSTTEPYAPACVGAQVEVGAGQGGAGLGHIGVPITFTNVGTNPCTLYGYPGVAGLNQYDQQVTQARRTFSGYLGGLYSSPNGPAPTVFLSPGQTASALVEGTDNPIGNATSCPLYNALLVTPPNTTTSVRLTVSLPGCSQIEVHPVVPGTNGILS